MSLFSPRKPVGGGSNFDPLQALTSTKSAGPGREVSQRDGPLLLRVVDDLAQAALKARNDFMVCACVYGYRGGPHSAFRLCACQRALSCVPR